jgi:RNA polymerase sigma factor (sigma-70 family)
MSSPPTTQLSLLDALREANPAPERWGQFFEIYAPLLVAWAEHQGFRGQDADDIAQEVLVTVSRKLPTYTREAGKSFRSWLYTITRHKAEDARRRRPPLPHIAPGTEVAIQAPDILAEEREYRVALIHRACGLIRHVFNEQTWTVFVRCKMNEDPVATVAADLGMTPQAVYAACSRVLVRLRGVIDGLVEEDVARM